MIQLNDSLKLTASTRKITDEGYLKATAALTRVGLQDYRLSDITGNINDKQLVKVLRPASTVFADETIESAKLKPITMYHPSTMVDSENHHNLSVGTIGENVHQLDKDRLGASIIITNKAIIDDIIAGKVSEVSMGYSADLKQESGIFNGQSYDYIFDGAMRINHCAIVAKGRCGESVSILDKKEDKLMTKEEIKELLLNDMDFKEVLKSLLNDLQQIKETQNEENITSTEGLDGSHGHGLQTSVDSNMEPVLNTEAEEVSSVLDNSSDEQVKEVEEQVIAIEAKDELAEQVKVRVKIIGKASSILKDEALEDLSNREILEKVFCDHKDKSDEYLIGMLDATVDNHNKAKYSLKAISDSYGSKISYNKRYSALEIQKL